MLNIYSVLLSIMMIVMSLERISSPLLALSKAVVAACEFFIVIDAPVPSNGELRDPEVSATEDIVFKDVTFAYPSRPRVKVLDKLDLTIEAGKLTAIVGPSGSGKSTIVGLIQRWYTLQEQQGIARIVDKNEKKKKNKEGEDGSAAAELLPDETGPIVELKGSVMTAGHGLDEIDLKWWRTQIGLVQQEPFLFNSSIYQNIAYGLVGSQWESEPEERKRELVKEACKEAFADEFIDRLPDVNGTPMGHGKGRNANEIPHRDMTRRLATAVRNCRGASASALRSPAASSGSQGFLSSTRLPALSTSAPNASCRPHSTRCRRTGLR